MLRRFAANMGLNRMQHFRPIFGDNRVHPLATVGVEHIHIAAENIGAAGVTFDTIITNIPIPYPKIATAQHQFELLTTSKYLLVGKGLGSNI